MIPKGHDGTGGYAACSGDIGKRKKNRNPQIRGLLDMNAPCQVRPKKKPEGKSSKNGSRREGYPHFQTVDRIWIALGGEGFLRILQKEGKGLFWLWCGTRVEDSCKESRRSTLRLGEDKGCAT